ncbi:hypothetical protein GOV07_01855 [Candidatus Woesearchaeota archaeon]|nr:hypothetical protein [Candidatus Woesearchaeota archaeon]
MARKKSVSRNSKKGSKKQDSGIWPVIGAAIVLILVVAAILLSAGEEPEYPVVTTEQAAKEAFRARGVSEIIVTDLSSDFASGEYTLKDIIAKYPGFETDITAVNEQLGTSQSDIVATVNGIDITRTALDTQLALLPDQYRQVLTDEQVLQEMIDEKLLMEEAANRGITLTEAELELAYQELLWDSELTEEQINENLAIFGLTSEDMRDMLERQQTINKLFAETVDKDLTPSKETVQAYYDENKASFQTGAEVTVKHILIANGDLEPAAVLSEAETVVARYEAGDDFCELVTEYTDDLGSKDKCGEYTFPTGFMVPEFEAASFAMAPDETRIVETQFGQHIILKVSDQLAVTKPYAEVEGDIVAILAGDTRREAYSTFIENLRTNAVITYGPPETVDVTPETPAVSEETEFVPVPVVDIAETPASTPSGDVDIIPIPVVETGPAETPAPVETPTGDVDIIPIPTVEIGAAATPAPVETPASSGDVDIIPIPVVETGPAPTTPAPTDDIVYVPVPVVDISGGVSEPISISEPVPEPIACPADIKQCADGSLVVRVAPDCEFQACPVVLDPVVKAEEPAPVDDLASCLQTKSVILYTAEWATASMDEAAKYGSMVLVKDCTDGCAAADLFPTWSIDGNKHLGSLEEHELAALAGC